MPKMNMMVQQQLVQQQSVPLPNLQSHARIPPSQQQAMAVPAISMMPTMPMKPTMSTMPTQTMMSTMPMMPTMSTSSSAFSGQGSIFGAQNQTTTNKLDSIVMIQDAEGVWELDSRLANIIGVTLQQLQQNLPSQLKSPQKEKLWATMLALAFLRLQFKHAKEQCDMIEEKSKLYIESLLGNGSADNTFSLRAILIYF